MSSGGNESFSCPPKIDVVGTGISLTSYDEVLALLQDRPRERASVFFFCNVHSVMVARRDPQLAQVLASADVAAPDGMPLVWTLRRLTRPAQTRVYGPDLMELALPYGLRHDWRHYFLGASADTLERLAASAHERAPGIAVAGMYAPPFRPLRPDEEDDIVDRVRRAGTDLLWVGLGMPKQEMLIARLRERLPGVALLGVGAAFDFLAGTVSQAPDWMQDRGLEWLYRLAREPRRLWRRYLYNNPTFVVLAARQLWSARRSS